MPSRWGAWVLAAVSGGGLVDAVVSFFWRGSGIDHTAGALLVVVSTAILVIIGLVLARPSRLHGLLMVLSILDVFGTGLAAYFLHAWVLLALMVIAALGWLALVPVSNRRADSGALV